MRTHLQRKAQATQLDAGEVVHEETSAKAQLKGLGYAEQVAALAPIQAHGDISDDVHAAAARGISAGGGALPHQARIQEAFGRHDIGAVQAHVGGAAAEACASMGASAYASRGAVAFGQSPDLHTAAHEAAHVVQQQAGVSLKGGVGQVGDPYERHADQVADAVVAGQSAEGLLDAHAGPAVAQSAVQAEAVQQERGPETTKTTAAGAKLLADIKRAAGGLQVWADKVVNGADLTQEDALSWMKSVQSWGGGLYAAIEKAQAAGTVISRSDLTATKPVVETAIKRAGEARKAAWPLLVTAQRAELFNLPVISRAAGLYTDLVGSVVRADESAAEEHDEAQADAAEAQQAEAAMGKVLRALGSLYKRGGPKPSRSQLAKLVTALEALARFDLGTLDVSARLLAKVEGRLSSFSERTLAQARGTEAEINSSKYPGDLWSRLKTALSEVG